VAHSISVIIPNHNNGTTIGKCLASVLASKYSNFELIVVDDCSTDDSKAEIKKFPCRLIELDEHKGAAGARNIGAQHSRSEILFFTDADCVLQKETLATAAISSATAGIGTIIGGTYTARPHDRGFFNSFQSLFIHYSETKCCSAPDYLATHALAINRSVFEKSGGFAENFMPILEDVEFSHRMKKKGFKLRLDPHIRVRHIFNFSLGRSLANAIRKASYWTLYSLRNHDLLADSGTASIELKVNVISLFLVLALTAYGFSRHNSVPVYLAALTFCGNMYVSRKLLALFYEQEGFLFLVRALLYYTLLYPLAVAIGAGRGMLLFAAGKYR
jgi:glycosyltransferase involved in cell wall biosynthesis